MGAYQKRFLEKGLLLERLAELAQKGLGSVMCAGGTPGAVVPTWETRGSF